MSKLLLIVSLIISLLLFSGCSGKYQIKENSIPLEVLNFTNSTINTTNLVIDGIKPNNNSILCIDTKGKVYVGVNNSC